MDRALERPGSWLVYERYDDDMVLGIVSNSNVSLGRRVLGSKKAQKTRLFVLSSLGKLGCQVRFSNLSRLRFSHVDT